MSVLKWDNDCMQDWFSAEDAVELVCHTKSAAPTIISQKDKYRHAVLRRQPRDGRGKLMAFRNWENRAWPTKWSTLKI
jgi:hypothetical protein